MTICRFRPCTLRITAIAAGLLLLANAVAYAQATSTPGASADARAVIGRPRPPLASVTYTMEGEAGFDPDTESFAYDRIRMHETAFKTGWPLYLGEDWRLLSGLDMQWYQLSFQGADVPDSRTHTINTYTLGMPFRVVTPAPEHWSGMLMFSPGLYSDMEDITWHDLRYAAMALATHKYAPDFSWSAGLAYGRIFGHEMLFPIAGLTWDPRPAWRVSLLFPRPGITYTPNPRLRLAAALMPAGNEWNVSDDFEGRRGDYDLRFEGYRAGAYLDCDLTAHIAVHCAAGLVFRRNYELLEHDDTIAEADVGETWFAQIGLAVR